MHWDIKVITCVNNETTPVNNISFSTVKTL